MRGSSKIFLMPPMSFGVQTRVTRNDPCGLPLPWNKTLLTLRIISIRFECLGSPRPGVGTARGVDWKSPGDVFNEIMGSAGPAALLTCALAGAFACLRVSAVPPQQGPGLAPAMNRSSMQPL